LLACLAAQAQACGRRRPSLDDFVASFLNPNAMSDIQAMLLIDIDGVCWWKVCDR
jgi:hypothetical protein